MTEEKKTRARAETTISFGVSAFPIELHREWKADCEKYFGDCHWSKMWTDHIKAKDVDKISKLEDRIAELESMIQAMKQPKKEEKVVETFTQKLPAGED